MTTKPCKKCGKEKSENEFSWKIKAKGLRQPICKLCAAAQGREIRAQRRALLGVEVIKQERAADYQKHRERELEYHRRYYWEHREHLLQKSKEYYQEHKEEQRAQARGRALKAKFGLTLEQYNQMVDDQDGKCAICGQESSNGKNLCVDHCHKTGTVRGLLCRPCNSFLGRINDSPELLERAKLYLQGNLHTSE